MLSGILSASVQVGVSRRPGGTCPYEGGRTAGARVRRSHGSAVSARRRSGIQSPPDDGRQRPTRPAPPQPGQAGGALLAESPRFADSFGLVLLLLVVSFFVIAAARRRQRRPHRLDGHLRHHHLAGAARRAGQAPHPARRARAHPAGDVSSAIILVLVGSNSPRQLVENKLLTILLVVVAPVARSCKRLVAHPGHQACNTFYGAVCVYLLIAMFFATGLRPHRDHRRPAVLGPVDGVLPRTRRPSTTCTSAS